MGLRVRIPPMSLMSVSCDCGMLWDTVSVTGQSLVQRNPTECVCVIQSLLRADHSSRGVLPSVCDTVSVTGQSLVQRNPTECVCVIQSLWQANHSSRGVLPSVCVWYSLCDGPVTRPEESYRVCVCDTVSVTGRSLVQRSPTECVCVWYSLCDGPVTRPEESYRVCVIQSLWRADHSSRGVLPSVCSTVSVTGQSLVQRSPTECVWDSLCDGPIIHPEESYRVCVRQSLWRADHSSRGVLPSVCDTVSVTGRSLVQRSPTECVWVCVIGCDQMHQ